MKIYYITIFTIKKILPLSLKGIQNTAKVSSLPSGQMELLNRTTGANLLSQKKPAGHVLQDPCPFSSWYVPLLQRIGAWLPKGHLKPV